MGAHTVAQKVSYKPPTDGAAAEDISKTIKHLSVFTVFVMIVSHFDLLTVFSAGY